METKYTEDEAINSVIVVAEKLASIIWSTGAYNIELYDKQTKQYNHKKPAHKSRKRVNKDGNSAKKKE